MKKGFIKVAGFFNLLTAFIHLILGQIDLANPMLRSDLNVQQKGEWIAVWHVVTVLLFLTSYILIKEGYNKQPSDSLGQYKVIGLFYILISIPFIVTSFIYSIFAPQWILLLPIGILLIYAVQTNENSAFTEVREF